MESAVPRGLDGPPPDAIENRKERKKWGGREG